MNRIIGIVITAAIVLASLAYLYIRPSAQQQAILAEVAAQIERHGVNDQLGGTLRALEPAVIYITRHSGEERPGDAEILACTFPGAVGISAAAFRDQFARWYIARGPVVAPDGNAYMVYLTR